MSHSKVSRPALFAAALGAAVAFTGAPAAAATPKVSCKIAKAVTRLPSPPVWFPVPQPFDTTLIVNGNALPTFAHGLRWQVETRYFFLVRLPRGGNVRDPKAKVAFSARFENLGRSVDVLRRRDGRLFAQWPTTGKGRDTTVVVSQNMASTEFGEFVASLRKVEYPKGCGTA